jgi:hypothetical protein
MIKKPGSAQFESAPRPDTVGEYAKADVERLDQRLQARVDPRKAPAPEGLKERAPSELKPLLPDYVGGLSQFEIVDINYIQFLDKHATEDIRDIALQSIAVLLDSTARTIVLPPNIFAVSFSGCGIISALVNFNGNAILPTIAGVPTSGFIPVDGKYYYCKGNSYFSAACAGGGIISVDCFVGG